MGRSNFFTESPRNRLYRSRVVNYTTGGGALFIESLRNDFIVAQYLILQRLELHFYRESLRNRRNCNPVINYTMADGILIIESLPKKPYRSSIILIINIPP